MMTEHEKIQEMIRQKEQAPLALDPKRTALIIVDVQRFFTQPDSEFAQVFQRLAPGAIDGYFQRVNSAVLPKIKELQHCFRSLGLPVIFCVFGSYAQNGRDLPCWLKDFDKLGLQLLGRRPNPVVNGASWQVDDAVAPVPGELIINKTSSGALSSTNLDQTLHNMGITSLAVCGLTTAVCVGLTARQTADRGFRVVMVSDACTELSQEMHEAALQPFSHVFGQVRSTQELTNFLAAGSSALMAPEAVSLAAS
ncbi:MAG TPA: isochorismatase family cysteine hydrolase [Terriglobales bacterium]|nr:isochorismatase family cysteine hydrolase [Terriglobales bacterium]